MTMKHTHKTLMHIVCMMLAYTVHAQDSLQTLHDNNPALYRSKQYTELSAGYYSASASKERITQLGNGGRSMDIEASSYRRLSDSDNVWGYAAYSNRRRDNVRWNENSDFLRLYPYVLGDARGGNLYGEQYMLHGGYNKTVSLGSTVADSNLCKLQSQGEHLARQQSHVASLKYGFELGYSAISEYRQKDPRPNNTTAFIYGKAGLGIDFSKLQIALALNAGKYKQTCEFAYMNELGSQIEYHITGVGNEFTRFAGSNNNTFYKGYVMGGQMDYLFRLPFGNTLSFSASAEHSSYEKILSDLNRLPLNRLNVNNFRGELSWQHTDKTAVRIGIDASDRNGFDNVFGDATGNIYPKIGSRRQYEGNSMTASLSALQRFILSNGTANANSKTTFSLLPSVAYHSFEGKHLGSGNFMNYENIIYGINVSAVYSINTSMLTAAVGLHRRNCIKHEADVAQTKNMDVAEAIHITDNYMSSGETMLTASLRYDYRLGNGYGLFVEAIWTHNPTLTLMMPHNDRLHVEQTDICADNVFGAKIGITL